MNKYSQIRQKYLNDRERLLSGRVDSLQVKLYDAIVKDLLDKMKLTADGKIDNSSANFDLVKKLDAVFKLALDKDIKGMMKDLHGELNHIINLNESYFAESVGSVPAVTLSSKKMGMILNSQLGITTQGKVIKGGFFDTIGGAKSVRIDTRKQLMKLITSKTDFISARNQMKEFIQGNKENGKQVGKLQQYFRNNVYDLYQKTDRTAGNTFAKGIGLNFFLYSGGIIAHSRTFCRKRNGKVFSRKDSEGWVNKIGDKDGPIYDPDTYDPLIDLGGWGCRHSIDWVTDSFAGRRGHPEAS